MLALHIGALNLTRVFALITLLPKENEGRHTKKFRLISLLNFSKIFF